MKSVVDCLATNSVLGTAMTWTLLAGVVYGASQWTLGVVGVVGIAGVIAIANFM